MSVEVQLGQARTLLLYVLIVPFSGYFARVQAYQILVDKFLSLTNQECQIVNLGAGYDTLYWLLHQKSTLPRLYVEVDFSNITTKKCHYIRYVGFPHS